MPSVPSARPVLKCLERMIRIQGFNGTLFKSKYKVCLAHGIFKNWNYSLVKEREEYILFCLQLDYFREFHHQGDMVCG